MAPLRVPLRGCRVPVKELSKEPLKEPPSKEPCKEGALKGALQGALKGTLKGAIKGALKGALKRNPQTRKPHQEAFQDVVLQMEAAAVAIPAASEQIVLGFRVWDLGFRRWDLGFWV